MKRSELNVMPRDGMGWDGMGSDWMESDENESHLWIFEEFCMDM